jgi:hypothetical protein
MGPGTAAADAISKWLQVLKDIAPSVKEVSVMLNPLTSPYNTFFMKSIEGVAPSAKTLNLQITPTLLAIADEVIE